MRASLLAYVGGPSDGAITGHPGFSTETFRALPESGINHATHVAHGVFGGATVTLPRGDLRLNFAEYHDRPEVDDAAK